MMTGVLRETRGKISSRSSVTSTYPGGIGTGVGIGCDGVADVIGALDPPVAEVLFVPEGDGG
jgi:hypothetical protein